MRKLLTYLRLCMAVMLCAGATQAYADTERLYGGNLLAAQQAYNSSVTAVGSNMTKYTSVTSHSARFLCATGGNITPVGESQALQSIKTRVGESLMSISGAGVGFDVNEGYVVTGITIHFQSNYAGTTLDMTECYIDGVKLTSGVTGATGATNSTTKKFEATGFQAFEHIDIPVVCNDISTSSTGRQGKFVIDVTYSKLAPSGDATNFSWTAPASGDIAGGKGTSLITSNTYVDMLLNLADAGESGNRITLRANDYAKETTTEDDLYTIYNADTAPTALGHGSGSIFIVKAKQNGVVTLSIFSRNNKVLNIYDLTDHKLVMNPTPTNDTTSDFSFQAIAGHTYIAYGKGTSEVKLHKAAYAYAENTGLASAQYMGYILSAEEVAALKSDAHKATIAPLFTKAPAGDVTLTDENGASVVMTGSNGIYAGSSWGVEYTIDATGAQDKSIDVSGLSTWTLNDGGTVDGNSISYVGDNGSIVLSQNSSVVKQGSVNGVGTLKIGSKKGGRPVTIDASNATVNIKQVTATFQTAYGANYIGTDSERQTYGDITASLVKADGSEAVIYTPSNNHFATKASGDTFSFNFPIENYTKGDKIVIDFDCQALAYVTVYYTEADDDGVAPELVSQTIANGASGLSKNGVAQFSFSKTVKIADASKITVSNTTDAYASTEANILTVNYWGDYDAEHTVTIPANTITDRYGNAKYAEDIVLTFTTGSKSAVEKKKLDFVVGKDGDINAAVNAAANKSNNDRYVVFVPNGEYKLTGNTTVTVDGNTFNNAMTQIRKNNVSIVGQSREGVTLYNIPTTAGISYTSTIEFRSCSGAYLQDLTLKNMYADGANDKGVAVAFYDRGTKTIAKNCHFWSNQDTYVSNGARGYYVGSEFAGTVDFICGNGDYYFDHCNLTINNRGGNVITAPRTTADEKWGYVFESCIVDKAEGATLVVDKGFHLGRPWDASPAATYLNTTFHVLPSDAGWTNMSAGKVCRFHEYGSKNSSGSALNLSSRSISACSPANGSDDPVLTAAQAAEYTLHKVIGGTDGYDPTEYCVTLAAPSLSLSGATLSWADDADARCYVIFKDGVYYDNVTDNSIALTEAGSYTVAAANMMGGLGELSSAVSYDVAVKVTVSSASWATFASAVDFTVNEADEVYYATAKNDAAVTVTALEAGAKVKAGEGVLVKGAGEHTFAATTGAEAISGNLLEGVLVAKQLADGEGYILALDGGKAVFSLCSAGTIAAGKSYLPAGALAAPALKIVFDDEDATVISSIQNADSAVQNSYNLAGQKVGTSYKGIVIKNGKKAVVK